jgi:LacI family transcriptional regulator
MSTSITLKELAKIAGVSISTISKALNDSHEISASTKKRIQEMAAQHNYQPNKIALNLKSGKTKTIGVVIPSIQNYFFAQVLFGIEKIIAASDYQMIISITNESHEKEAKAIRTFSNGLVDGFIVALAEETQIQKKFAHFEKVHASKKPMVMFDRVIKDFPCDQVLVNDNQVVFETAKKLLEDGKKNLLLVSAIHNLSVGKSRAQGFAKATENGSKIEGTPDVLDELLEKHLSETTVDAIIALDIDASLSSLRVAKKLGKEIPNELSIVGYASEKMANNLSPQLTTLNQHGSIIGEKAAEMMLHKLKIGVLENKTEIIDTTIVKRQTY